MPQINSRPGGNTAALLDSAAKAAGVSRSQWIGDAVHLRARTEWPASVRVLARAGSDFPALEQIRRSPGKHPRREQL